MDGCEVVYGVRNDRHSDGFFKKATATAYYKLMHMITHITTLNRNIRKPRPPISLSGRTLMEVMPSSANVIILLSVYLECPGL